MSSNDPERITELIYRLGRVMAADEWAEGLNPTQWAALSYLARANKFSRAPSQVSDFMAATRGTVSQTLKALAKKGLISEIPSAQDKRSISYAVTKQGAALLRRPNLVEEAVSSLKASERSSLRAGLETLARTALRQRGSRSFGVCKTCVHHRKVGRGGYCQLLDEPLSPTETTQICHEHAEAA
ncbi:MAG: MarR family transcriptional regulator [Pseudomonadota bacterium]